MDTTALIEKERMRKAAELFRVLGHPRRIEILVGLEAEPMRAKDISVRVGIPFKDITNDIGVLCGCGAIRRREGRFSPWEITTFGRALLQAYYLFSHMTRPEPGPRPRAPGLSTVDKTAPTPSAEEGRS